MGTRINSPGLAGNMGAGLAGNLGAGLSLGLIPIYGSDEGKESMNHPGRRYLVIVH